MAIEFTCPGCQGRYRIPDSFAGKKLRCKKCGHVNTAPAVAPRSRSASSAAGRELNLASEDPVWPGPAPKATAAANESPAAGGAGESPIQFQDEDDSARAAPLANPAELDMDLICLGESKIQPTKTVAPPAKAASSVGSSAPLPPDKPIEEPNLEGSSSGGDLAAAANVLSQVVSADPMAARAVAAPPVERSGRMVRILGKAMAPVLMAAVALLQIALAGWAHWQLHRAGQASVGAIAWLWGMWIIGVAAYFAVLTPLALAGMKLVARFVPAWLPELKYTDAAAMTAVPVLVILASRWVPDRSGLMPLMIVGAIALAFGVLMWVGRLKVVAAGIAFGAGAITLLIGVIVLLAFITDIFGGQCIASWWTALTAR